MWDAVVIGTGAGGGAAGWMLASSGKKVLFLERGHRLTDPEVMQDEEAMLIDMKAADQRPHSFGSVTASPFTGGIVGGSTSLYGACLLRPGSSDFHPGAYYGSLIDPAIHHWPVDYDEFEPWFTAAEDRLKVAGDTTVQVPFLHNRQAPYPGRPLPLHPFNEKLSDTLTRSGLTPFPLPLGIDSETCKRCASCPGYGCPIDARASSTRCFISPAITDHDAEIQTGVDILGIECVNRVIRSMRIRIQHEEITIRSGVWILSAGALGSPVFMMEHGLTGSNPHIGRNYMYHLGVLFLAFSRELTGSGTEFIKQLGITDFYIDPDGHKLGYIQQLPIPGPRTLQAEMPAGMPMPKPLAAFFIRHAISFAGVIEDLPQPSNRVVEHNGTILIRHQYHTYDIFRAKRLRKLFGPHFRRTHRIAGGSIIAVNEKRHVAHQVGTCRFGNNERHAVLDRYCRVHHLDNLFIVDGSFMPSALGVGPALTIMANGLRVGDYLAGSNRVDRSHRMERKDG